MYFRHKGTIAAFGLLGFCIVAIIAVALGIQWTSDQNYSVINYPAVVAVGFGFWVFAITADQAVTAGRRKRAPGGLKLMASIVATVSYLGLLFGGALGMAHAVKPELIPYGYWFYAIALAVFLTSFLIGKTRYVVAENTVVIQELGRDYAILYPGEGYIYLGALLTQKAEIIREDIPLWPFSMTVECTDGKFNIVVGALLQIWMDGVTLNHMWPFDILDNETLTQKARQVFGNYLLGEARSRTIGQLLTASFPQQSFGIETLPINWGGKLRFHKVEKVAVS